MRDLRDRWERRAWNRMCDRWLILAMIALYVTGVGTMFDNIPDRVDFIMGTIGAFVVFMGACVILYGLWTERYAIRSWLMGY